MMLTSYLKVTIRNLLKHKGFSLISILGLAASMSVCLLIIVFLRMQMSYDGFHAKAGRIYHIYSDYKAPINSSSHLYATAPASLGETLKSELTGIENYVTLRRYGGNVLRDDQEFQIRGFYASPSFLDVLDFRLVIGNPESALRKPRSMVITQRTAERLFGSENPLGATLSVEEQGEFLVTGVVANTHAPTIFDFEVLTSFATLQSDPTLQRQLQKWDDSVRSFYSFVLLEDGASISDIQALFPTIIAQHFPGDEESHLVSLETQKLTSVAMGPIMDNQIRFVLPMVVLYVLAGLAGVILFAACFNYVSLSVARALQRAKEVGVRKVVGAMRKQILSQFLIEAVIISLLALLLGGAFLILLIDGFNNLTPVQLTQSQVHPDFNDVGLYLIFFAFSILVGLLSGLYPALYLSSFLPTVVLKGIAKIKGKGFTLRKSLIVTQFALSLLFIISTLLIYQQSEHTTHADYGFNEKDVINVQLADVEYGAFRTELLRNSSIANVSAVSILTGSGGRRDTWMKSEQLNNHEKAYSVAVDEHFLENMHIPLVAGRNFKIHDGGEIESTVLLNETAVERLQLGTTADALGQIITIEDSKSVQVIGVVQDFAFFSVLASIDPLLLRKIPQQLAVANVRFQTGTFDAAMAHIESTWQTFRPNHAIEYGLYEHQLADALELKLMRDFLHIIGLAAGFAIIIASLGLLGMTAYMTQTRLKEIGVRKVLGATSVSIVGFLSKSFIRLIVIAIALAAPLAWIINDLWLQNIGNRIDIAPPVFIAGILMLLIIALLAIGSQTVRAARTNPTVILKYE